MSITNLKSKADKARKTKDYLAYLRAQASLNNKTEDAYQHLERDVQLGLPAKPKPLDSRVSDWGDLTQQRLLATEHLSEIMAQPTEGLRYLPEVYDLFLFNRHWTDFKAQLKGQKYITPFHFHRLWERYLEMVNATNHTGITIPLDSTVFQQRLDAAGQQVINEIRNIHPGQGVGPQLRGQIEAIVKAAVAEGNTRVVNRLLSILEGMADGTLPHGIDVIRRIVKRVRDGLDPDDGDNGSGGSDGGDSGGGGGGRRRRGTPPTEQPDSDGGFRSPNNSRSSGSSSSSSSSDGGGGGRRAKTVGRTSLRSSGSESEHEPKNFRKPRVTKPPTAQVGDRTPDALDRMKKPELENEAERLGLGTGSHTYFVNSDGRRVAAQRMTARDLREFIRIRYDEEEERRSKTKEDAARPGDVKRLKGGSRKGTQTSPIAGPRPAYTPPKAAKPGGKSGGTRRKDTRKISPTNSPGGLDDWEDDVFAPSTAKPIAGQRPAYTPPKAAKKGRPAKITFQPNPSPVRGTIHFPDGSAAGGAADRSDVDLHRVRQEARRAVQDRAERRAAVLNERAEAKRVRAPATKRKAGTQLQNDRDAPTVRTTRKLQAARTQARREIQDRANARAAELNVMAMNNRLSGKRKAAVDAPVQREAPRVRASRVLQAARTQARREVEARANARARQLEAIARARTRAEAKANSKTSKSKHTKKGRGLMAPVRSERYDTFGRYLIHLPSLRKNIWNMKYPSKAVIPNLTPIAITSELRTFITNLLEEGVMSHKQYNALSVEDQRTFTQMAKRSHLAEVLGLDTEDQDDKKRDEVKRFEVLRGEIMAGNDNPAIVAELKKLLLKFIASGDVPRQQGYGLLYEISCLA